MAATVAWPAGPRPALPGRGGRWLARVRRPVLPPASTRRYHPASRRSSPRPAGRGRLWRSRVPPMGDQVALLEVTGATRSFYGVRALDGADLRVEARRITGLIGPNGAGKT